MRLQQYFSLLLATVFCLLPLPSDACVDMTISRVGSAQVVFTYHPQRSQIEICFSVKLSPGVSAKYVGFRYPDGFKSSSSQASKVLELSTGYVKPGFVRAYNFKKDKKYCLTLQAQPRMTFIKQKGDVVEVRQSAYQTYLSYVQQMRNKNLGWALSNVIQKEGRAGVTIGSEFFTGSSGAKGGCGTATVPWQKLKPKPRAVNAKRDDFQ